MDGIGISDELSKDGTETVLMLKQSHSKFGNLCLSLSLSHLSLLAMQSNWVAVVCRDSTVINTKIKMGHINHL